MKAKERVNFVRTLLTLCVVVGSLIGTSARCATLLVDNKNDNGAGSLWQAIADKKNLGDGETSIFSNVVIGLANVSRLFQPTDTNEPLFPVRFYRALSP